MLIRKALTIKYKLVLVAIAAVAGFAVQGGVAFSVLERLSDNFLDIDSAQRVMKIVTDTEVKLLALSLRRSSLTAKELENFAAQIGETADDRSKALEQAVIESEFTALKKALEDLNTTMAEHLQDLASWQRVKQTLGVDVKSGLLGELIQIGDTFEADVKGFAYLEKALSRLRGAVKDFLLKGDPVKLKAVETTATDLKNAIDRLEFQDTYLPILDKYNAAFAQVADRYMELRKLEKALDRRIPMLIDTVGRASTLLEDDVLPKARAMANAAVSQTPLVLLASAVMAAFIIALMLTLIGRRIIRGLQDTAKVMSTVAEGDLTLHLSGYDDQRDEFDHLAIAVNQMVDDLKRLVGHVSQASVEMASASDGLVDATDTLASGNRQISEQAQQVATASEQMNATAVEVSQTTADLHHVTEQTSATGSESTRIMLRTGDAIENINQTVNNATDTVRSLAESATKIGVVVEVIGEIAGQTNLLALNAAIEAARAGEAGRGFAVVADEVRNLASKTLQATTQITETVELIQGQSRDAVNDMIKGQEVAAVGAERGNEAVASMERLESQFAGAADRTAQIATAIEQMSVTISDISRNIEHVATGVVSNEQAANELARTAGLVAEKADGLKSIIGHFRL